MDRTEERAATAGTPPPTSDRARAEALRTSIAEARGCAARRDWGCAVGEADFALSIDGSNAEMSALRRDAGREQALVQVERARAQVAQGQLRQADGTLKDAQRLSNDPKVLQGVSQVAGGLVTAAVAESDRQRAARQYGEALAVLQLALPYEAGLRDRIELVKREQAAFLRAEHDRLMAEGEVLLSRSAWSEAAARFQAAGAAAQSWAARRPDQSMAFSARVAPPAHRAASVGFPLAHSPMIHASPRWKSPVS